MERTLRQSLEMSGGDMWIFAERPLAAALLALALGVLALAGPADALPREADLPVVGVDPQNLHLDRIADLHHLLGILHLILGEFRDVEQPLEAVLEPDRKDRYLFFYACPGSDTHRFARTYADHQANIARCQ